MNKEIKLLLRTASLMLKHQAENITNSHLDREQFNNLRMEIDKTIRELATSNSPIEKEMGDLEMHYLPPKRIIRTLTSG